MIINAIEIIILLFGKYSWKNDRIINQYTNLSNESWDQKWLRY